LRARNGKRGPDKYLRVRASDLVKILTMNNYSKRRKLSVGIRVKKRIKVDWVVNRFRPYSMRVAYTKRHYKDGYNQCIFIE